MKLMNENDNHDRIVRKYFSNEAKSIRLKKGEVLLEQYELNDRLFYVEEGKVCGYLPDKNLQEPVFEAGENSFVGVYSYFSQDRKSYSQVLAAEDSVVRYYNDNPFDMPAGEAQEFLTFLFNVVVKELRHRQHFAGTMARERQETLQKLIQSEKMVTLGQMAAGLAHELNNTIASLSGNLRQVEEAVASYLQSNENEEAITYFQKGFQEGQQMTSADARALRKELKKLKFLDKDTSKKLPRAGLTLQEVEKTCKGETANAKKIASFWELGYLLHDMQIVALHASHVIKSVKSVGVANQQWSNDVNVNRTIDEALAILRSITRGVEVEKKLDDQLPVTEACSGELVQVWINLIKNAVESLVNSQTANPKIQINTSYSDISIRVGITDNGPGIPDDLYEKVFQPNFTTKVGGLSFGLGLGLTIVKRIINEHNGDIKLSSKPGHTCFEVYLPIVKN